MIVPILPRENSSKSRNSATLRQYEVDNEIMKHLDEQTAVEFGLHVKRARWIKLMSPPPHPLSFLDKLESFRKKALGTLPAFICCQTASNTYKVIHNNKLIKMFYIE